MDRSTGQTRFLSTSTLWLCLWLWLPAWLFSLGTLLQAGEFEDRILPLLDDYCIDCHEPGNSEHDIQFLDLTKAEDIQRQRGIWRSVAVQLRNRTMPPAKRKNQPSDKERAELATWIDSHLVDTACDDGPFAGHVRPRRLNRLDYNNTVETLFGVDLRYHERLPADGGTGEGFDNSGDALFLPPMLLERYLENAQEIVDAAIQSPRLDRTFEKKNLVNERGALASIYVEAEYRTTVNGHYNGEKAGMMLISIDGVPGHRLPLKPKQDFELSLDLRLARGTHAIEFSQPIKSLRLRQFEPKKLTGSALAFHKKLTGLEPGKKPKDSKALARKQLVAFLPLAFRRPVTDGDVDASMRLVRLALERGDPYEEAMKLALRGVLVSSDFLFRLERENPKPGTLQPLDDFELATRLSYFLWSSPPDAELRELAAKGTLNQDKTLQAQVERMLADQRAMHFAKSFTGQWLGTKDVGGRVAPTANDVQKFYTADIASDMRDEAVWFMAHLLREDRPLLELIDADYTFLSGRLATFYQLKLKKPPPKNELRRVALPDRRRGGVLGMGAVLALTSHHKKTSPVLRGAWVFDTLIGEPVPPPPEGIPPLSKSKQEKSDTERLILERHREHTACNACHNLIDPIGFGLQNFDWVGRWRDKENNKPVDASGRFADGTTFAGPAEMKQTLLATHKDAFVRNLTRKMLAYALGRSLADRDDCLIQEIAEQLAAKEFGAQTLVKEIVMSPQFRNR